MPLSLRALTMLLPIKPAPPVTMIITVTFEVWSPGTIPDANVSIISLVMPRQTAEGLRISRIAIEARLLP